MTALPKPGQLLTIADYAALPEDEQYRWELQEGNLTMAPSPTPPYNHAAFELAVQFRTQLPPDLMVVPDVDLDLTLAPADEPGSARRPDLVVVTRTAFDRVRDGGGLLLATDARLVVELVSPGSRRTDRVVKHGEYADAGIPHYWIVDLEGRPSLVACQLAEGFGYQDAPAVTGRFSADEPFPVTVDLDALG
ncbi:Uma2 family endonuclease [uncultured Jatrophihabitans sp.]|uniref:Uma2 family endonuclease n=1 Tax=uncultured Jatrophihabitans sp. TaxID=1610747 RepID=UPI0035C9CD8E